jgi:flagellar protein FlgJ
MKIQNTVSIPMAVEKKERVEKPEVMKAAKQFEAIFVNQMVGAMRKTVTKGGMFPESNGERIYQSMLDSEYADKISETDQLGLSQMIYQHLLNK